MWSRTGSSYTTDTPLHYTTTPSINNNYVQQLTLRNLRNNSEKMVTFISPYNVEFVNDILMSLVSGFEFRSCDRMLFRHVVYTILILG
jgi:hypothetical protein